MTPIYITETGDLTPAVRRHIERLAIKAIARPMLVTLPPAPTWTPSEGSSGVAV